MRPQGCWLVPLLSTMASPREAPLVCSCLGEGVLRTFPERPRTGGSPRRTQDREISVSREWTSEKPRRDRAHQAEHAAGQNDRYHVEAPLPERECREGGEAEHDGDPINLACWHECDPREWNRDGEHQPHHAARHSLEELLDARPGGQPVHVPRGAEHEDEGRQEEPEGCGRR